MPNKNHAKPMEKKCPRCLGYVRAGSRKCKFCGYKFKSTGQYLVDKIKDVLRIERAYIVVREKSPRENESLFTQSEIEMLLKLNDVYIPMFIILDNINLIDEMALMELGEMLINMNKDYVIVR